MEALVSFFATMWLMNLAIAIVVVIGTWKMYEKANKPGGPR